MNEIKRLETNVDQAMHDLSSVKEAIVSSGVDVPNGTRTSEYAGKVTDVYNKGKRNGESTFLNMLSNNNNRKNYYGVFASSNLEGYTFPYTIKPGDIGRMFYVYVGKYMPGNIDFSQATESTGGYYQTFCWADVLEEIYFNAPAPTGQYLMTFAYCRKVKKIDRINVLEQTTFSQAFLQCYELEEITIGGTIGQTVSFSDSPLNKTSIENVIGTLSSSASGKTLELKSSAVTNAFGSTDSDEWKNLIATKSNWTITLV